MPESQTADGPVYLDCNATTPVDPRIADEVYRHMVEEFGNAGSRTHEYGNRAKKAVEAAREQVATVVDARREEVIFTSGATESNNLALLGLAAHGERMGKRHIVSTQIEHKAILDPLEHLQQRGFEVTLVQPTQGGWVEPEAVAEALREDTLLVSVMHVNNETGVIQPIAEMVDRLKDHDAYFHTDAAQGFGKDLDQLRHPRIDMISISGHKLYAPKGIGAMVLRRRKFRRPPLGPIMHGGGQERGIRPGTLPVHLIIGLGKASELANEEHQEWRRKCVSFREELLNALAPLDPQINGDLQRTAPHTLNLSFAEIDSEAVMLALRDLVAISNGSACTSAGYDPSHVLQALGLPAVRARGATRWSWCHQTVAPDWPAVTDAIRKLL